MLYLCMDTPDEIRKIAEQRLKEAEILFENDMLDGAFYLAGYSVELTLKAKISERFDVPNLFYAPYDNDNYENKKQCLEKSSNERLAKTKKQIRSMVQTHDFDVLMLFCGLHSKYLTFIQSNQDVYTNIMLVETWTTNIRYKKIGSITKEQVEKIILFLKDKNEGLLQWINNN